MDAPTTPVKEVVDYVKDELAVEGVEVKGWGPRSVTLKLPYELPELNEVIDVIMARSGGRSRLQTRTTEGCSSSPQTQRTRWRRKHRRAGRAGWQRSCYCWARSPPPRSF